MGIPSAEEVSNVEEATGVAGDHLDFGLFDMGVAAEEVPDVEETAAVGIGHVHDLDFVPTTKEAVEIQSLIATTDNTVLGLDLRSSAMTPSARGTGKGQAPTATMGLVRVFDLVTDARIGLKNVSLERLPGCVVPVLAAQPLKEVPKPTSTLHGRRVMARFYSGGL